MTPDETTVTASRPMVLVRYRPGVVGETARTVHIVSLPTDEQAGTVSALCGAPLRLADVETVAPDQGMPCTACVLTTAASRPPLPDPELPAGHTCYLQWGWPVTRHQDQVRLSLHGEISALAIPLLLGIEVTEILIARGCAPAVLAHPYAPEHAIVLTSERHGTTLPWPYQVHRVIGVLLLPPTPTPRGPITWTQPPQPDRLPRCREIDLFEALRTALHAA